MKRCPQCNCAETDEALKFCRVDGAALISDSFSIDQEGGTVKLGSGQISVETVTGILPHATDSNINRETARTSVLQPQPPAATGTDAKPRRLTTEFVIAIRLESSMA